MNHLIQRLAAYYVDMPWQTALCFAAAFFIFCCVVSLIWCAWRQPDKVDQRATAKRRKANYKLIKQIAKSRLRRHDPSADRDCYRVWR